MTKAKQSQLSVELVQQATNYSMWKQITNHNIWKHKDDF